MKDAWESYFIDDTHVLKNKLNINNNKELTEKEKQITLKKLAYLELLPIEGELNEEHLKKIHKFLFSDIYPFAGEYRTCTMAKLREFVLPQDIEITLKKYLYEMNLKVNDIISVDGYAHFLSEAYYNLMVIHPFREGNGRSVREFLREFVIVKNKYLPFSVELDFSKINPEEALAAVRERYLYPSMLEMIFRGALVTISKEDCKGKAK